VKTEEASTTSYAFGKSAKLACDRTSPDFSGREKPSVQVMNQLMQAIYHVVAHQSK
jgi:hypothetical protein